MFGGYNLFHRLSVLRLVMPVMVGERCRTETGIQDVKNEYTGPQTHTGYRITVRYDGQNDNVNLILVCMGPRHRTERCRIGVRR
jgi:hypothetical protein